MKKTIGIMGISILCAIILILGTTFKTENSEYLRIHIRANSNSAVDQAIKYQIKDAVVDYMIPILSSCQTKAESICAIEANLNSIEKIAESILYTNGLSYDANATIKNEEFPTRSYGNLTLESGFYDALILNLGKAEGNNWWCVVYPPLCFVNGGSTTNVFKSRILEVINNFF